MSELGTQGKGDTSSDTTDTSTANAAEVETKESVSQDEVVEKTSSQDETVQNVTQDDVNDTDSQDKTKSDGNKMPTQPVKPHSLSKNVLARMIENTVWNRTVLVKPFNMLLMEDWKVRKFATMAEKVHLFTGSDEESYLELFYHTHKDAKEASTYFVGLLPDAKVTSINKKYIEEKETAKVTTEGILPGEKTKRQYRQCMLLMRLSGIDPENPPLADDVEDATIKFFGDALTTCSIRKYGSASFPYCAGDVLIVYSDKEKAETAYNDWKDGDISILGNKVTLHKFDEKMQQEEQAFRYRASGKGHKQLENESDKPEEKDTDKDDGENGNSASDTSLDKDRLKQRLKEIKATLNKIRKGKLTLADGKNRAKLSQDLIKEMQQILLHLKENTSDDDLTSDSEEVSSNHVFCMGKLLKDLQKGKKFETQPSPKITSQNKPQKVTNAKKKLMKNQQQFQAFQQHQKAQFYGQAHQRQDQQEKQPSSNVEGRMDRMEELSKSLLQLQQQLNEQQAKLQHQERELYQRQQYSPQIKQQNYNQQQNQIAQQRKQNHPQQSKYQQNASSHHQQLRHSPNKGVHGNFPKGNQWNHGTCTGKVNYQENMMAFNNNGYGDGQSKNAVSLLLDLNEVLTNQLAQLSSEQQQSGKQHGYQEESNFYQQGGYQDYLGGSGYADDLYNQKSYKPKLIPPGNDVPSQSGDGRRGLLGDHPGSINPHMGAGGNGGASGGAYPGTFYNSTFAGRGRGRGNYSAAKKHGFPAPQGRGRAAIRQQHTGGQQQY